MPDASNELPVTELLTGTATTLLSLNADHAYTALVVNGRGNEEARKILSSIKPSDLLTQPIVKADAGNAILSGLWLWHDWLDQSHTLSQDIHSTTGSFWHAHLQLAIFR